MCQSNQISFPVVYLFAALCLLPGRLFGAWPFQQPQAGMTYATDHIVVKLRPDAARGKNSAQLTAMLGLPLGAELVETAFALWNRDVAGPKNPRGGAPMDLERHLLLRLPAGMSVETCLDRLRGHPAVVYAEPDYVGQGGGTWPTDPDFDQQWHLYNTNLPSGHVRADIHAPEAWDITRGSSNVVVAVLDSGLNLTLSEFSGRLVAGYDFANNDADPTDDHGHGTAVTGALGANANNGTLVSGVNWNCRIMPVKVLGSNNKGYYSWWADGIDWAVDNGCKVINLSAGGTDSDVTLTAAIRRAISNGVVFVTITHNDGSSNIRFPGELAECITVGATTESDARASFSNYGAEIDLVAPGDHIYTVTRFDTLQWWWGTSFAAPQVAAVAAMLAGLDPDINQEQARVLLARGADDEVGDATDTPGFDNYYGWGRLNAYNTLMLAMTEVESISRAGAGGVQLTWQSPPNASNNAPYLVEGAAGPAGPWSGVTGSGVFTYGTTQTSWQTELGAEYEVYRVRVSPD